jgi:hypothetical protein
VFNVTTQPPLKKFNYTNIFAKFAKAKPEFTTLQTLQNRTRTTISTPQTIDNISPESPESSGKCSTCRFFMSDRLIGNKECNLWLLTEDCCIDGGDCSIDEENGTHKTVFTFGQYSKAHYK